MPRFCFARNAGVSAIAQLTPALDEEQGCTVVLLLLGKGAVLAHGFDRPLAVEMDDDQQSWRGGRGHRDTRLR